ncbi:MAG: hypothetical protein CYPHOPRED_000067 [Cyphobasidiales sp. Tagirdzhanova-0007]|nr:MAG: hypothetical protein CYPHOPRED_000067 [Cyphobasidiales sp. Tagirdzhanova-0007]
MASTRYPPLVRDELDAKQRDYYDKLDVGVPMSHGPNGELFTYKDSASGAFLGPYGFWMHTPGYGMANLPVNKELSALPIIPTLREVAILVVAAHHGTAYVTYCHDGTA